MQKKWLEIMERQILQLGQIVIWGAGLQAKILIKLLKYLGLGRKVYALVDSDPGKFRGGGIEGMGISSPKDIDRHSGTVLVMCHDFFNVKEMLEQQGYDVYEKYDIYYIVEELYKRQMSFKDEKLECYGKPYASWGEELKAHSRELGEVYGLLQDKVSRETLNARLELLRTGDYVDFYLNCPVMGAGAKAYFAPELWESSLGGTLADCGAYIGDSALDFMECAGGNFGRVISFEPNLESYEKYLKNVQDQRCKAYPYGVGRPGVGAVNGQGIGAYLGKAEGGGDKVPVVSLDEFLQGEKISFLKMDIEGGELEALKGAKAVIAESRPKLAICLYHKPKDIFEIPLYLNGLGLGYTFRIRQHCFRGDKFDIRDTILYGEVLGED